MPCEKLRFLSLEELPQLSSHQLHDYRELTGDQSSPNDCGEAEIDELFLKMEPDDHSFSIDLWEVKDPQHKTKYDALQKIVC